MTAARLLNSGLLAFLLVFVTSHAVEQEPIVVALEEGKLIAYFNLGKSRCVLRNDQVRCVTVEIK